MRSSITRLIQLVTTLGTALVILLGFAPEQAGAGTYIVRQCHTGIPAEPGAADAERITSSVAYAARNNCTETANENALRVVSTNNPAGSGQYGRVQWLTPAEVLITHVQADGKVRRDNGHRARIYAASENHGAQQRLLTGDGTATGWQSIPNVAINPPRRRLVTELYCNLAGGDWCLASEIAKAWIRNLRLTLYDSGRPTVSVSSPGGLLSGGWKHGTGDVSVAARDGGTGVLSLGVAVNGITMAGRTFSCDLGSGYARRLQPCPPTPPTASAGMNTAASPWREGDNRLLACAYDYASAGLGSANSGCWSQSVLVDNVPPHGAFRGFQDPADPELIVAKVGDATSGLASGLIRYRPVGGSAWTELETELAGDELRAQVDSEKEPPGDYEVTAVVDDQAGHSTTVTDRADGEPMVLSFPLRETVQLSYTLNGGRTTATVPYGTRQLVRGRLVDSMGRGIAGAKLGLIEAFSAGAAPGQRSSEVETDEDGAFSVRLSAGPSRKVRLAYAGSRRYRPLQPHRELGYWVRSEAKLSKATPRVKAGGRAVFRGKIKRRGAVIPGPGKLYELQVRAGERKWITVEQARHSRADGRIRFGYRFGPHYTRAVRFRFRIKVSREARWPYLAPVRSNPRTVTVVPR